MQVIVCLQLYNRVYLKCTNCYKYGLRYGHFHDTTNDEMGLYNQRELNGPNGNRYDKRNRTILSACHHFDNCII
ncbi:hypothetical protein GCM10008983_21290 [Lentibacillus halophilus]|uniref:Uncharacterized protein n=1 Tax=Lentibacillus halophilus TaxID=295065 RepID=A0ABN0ZD05_9BACI